MPARPFETLTEAGQVRRIRPIAAEAARRFGLAEARLAPVQHGENTIWRADLPGSGAADGRFVAGRYALRVHGIDYQSPADIRSELAWRAALAAAGYPVPAPVVAADGSPLVQVEAPEALGARSVSVLRWMRGRLMHELPPASRYRRIGWTLAGLHEHGAQWRRPAWYVAKTWDWDGLLGGTIQFAGTNASECWPLLPAARRRRWERASDAFRAALDDLGRGAGVFGLIHADPHPGNLLYGDGEIRALDFDDSGWGWYLYDFAVALGAAQRRGECWERVRDTFFAGYEERRPVTRGSLRYLDLFFAARTISIALWVVGMTRINPAFADYLPGIYERADHLFDVMGM